VFCGVAKWMAINSNRVSPSGAAGAV
jgi:hypothetical protein